MSSLKWNSSAQTHTGYVRQHNEDAYLDAREQCLWVVADGMGGHNAGDLASQIIIENLVNFHPQQDMTKSVDAIEQRLIAANTQCRKNRTGSHTIMGSTVAVLYAQDEFCFSLWAGDSRIYRLRNGSLSQMTEDHSLVQEMVNMGEISQTEALNHPSSNVITRAIGVRDQLFVDIEYATADKGDRFLLCSDGLSKELSAEDIAKTMSSTPVEQASKTLVQQALAKGGSDNITAIVVQVGY